jgi:sialate O-acetylesterase
MTQQNPLEIQFRHASGTLRSILPSVLPTRAWMILGAVLTLAAPAQGAAKIASAFTDHMVLQRDLPLAVWGKADPGEKITVKFAKQRKETVTDKDGRWKLTLDPMKANVSPSQMTVISSNEKQALELSDILIGDVWLCSGQSNMQMGLAESFDGPKEIAAATCPLIRMLIMPKGGSNVPREDANLAWKLCSPAVMTDNGGFSAVGYYFGRELQQTLKVPVGLIDSTVGGTPVESWTPPLAPNQPGGDLFNGMITPVVPYGLRGCIWYQGEYNLALFGDTLNYTAKMKALIDGWRSLWSDRAMPFYYVQLAPLDWQSANYPNYKNLPVFWEAQTKIQSLLPHTGMVITTDVTDDLTNIHPKDKKTVGSRLAALALHETYGLTQRVCRGPEFKSMRVDGPRAIITFDGCDGGLKTRDAKPVDWFTLAGADGIYQPAVATLTGKNQVTLVAEAVPTPVTVRFAWDCKAMANLCNGAGFPANAFRTDLPDPNANQNLAMNKPVKVSGGTQGQMLPANAVDGVTDNWSGWHSSGAPQWLEVDLQKIYSIDRIKVVTYFDGVRFYQYKVEASLDGKTWQQVADMSANTRISTETGETVRFPAIKAQFVRVTLLKNSANTALHLNELLVFETGTSAKP